MAPLFGLLSTMIVTGKMSFFSDALGHSGFTGIAIGVLCGAALPIVWAVGVAVLFALLFSYVRARTNQAADTVIGVFSSTAVALGIFIATMGGGSFTKFNTYLIGDILSVTPLELGLLALVLLGVIVLWCISSNRLVLTAIHPALASSITFCPSSARSDAALPVLSPPIISAARRAQPSRCISRCSSRSPSVCASPVHEQRKTSQSLLCAVLRGSFVF